MINILCVYALIVNSLFVGFGKCVVNWNENNSAMACDFFKNDLLNARIALSQCSQRCYNISRCTHYAWSQHLGGTCWMKKGSVSRSDAFSTLDGTMGCGIINRTEQTPPPAYINWNGSFWTTACHFDGNDFYRFRTPSESCANRCSNIFGCTHFVWTQFEGGTCWTKNGSVSPSDAYATFDETMICGIVNNTKQYLDDRAATDTYWDCCKPTCNWPYEINGTSLASASSEICQDDGVTILDNNKTLGCSNGSAYHCINRIPWSVSPDLSYGFAAATIAVRTFLCTIQLIHLCFLSLC